MWCAGHPGCPSCAPVAAINRPPVESGISAQLVAWGGAREPNWCVGCANSAAAMLSPT